MSNQHVVPYNDKWAVKKEGSEKVTRIYDNQSDAIEYAKEIAKNQKSELIIHGKDGKIREKNTYKKDPYPPKG